MSIDLDYSLLSDPALLSNLLTNLNSSLASTSLPSYLGPISITALDFGTDAPELEVVGLRDIFKEFLEVEDEDSEEENEYDDQQQGFREEEEHSDFRDEDDEDGDGQQSADGSGEMSRYFQEAVAVSNHSGLGVHPNGSDLLFQQQAWRDHVFPSTPIPTSSFYATRLGLGGQPSLPSLASRAPSPSPPSLPPPPPVPLPKASSSASIPSLQLHLALSQLTKTLRLSISTSLLINHPSPKFMTLPLSLTVTKLHLELGLVVALQAPGEVPTSSHSTQAGEDNETMPMHHIDSPPNPFYDDPMSMHGGRSQRGASPSVVGGGSHYGSSSLPHSQTPRFEINRQSSYTGNYSYQAQRQPSQPLLPPPQPARVSSKQRSKIHLTILDPQSPLFTSQPSSTAPPSMRGTLLSTPFVGTTTTPSNHTPTHHPLDPSGGQKPLPIGHRLIPSLEIESEIGQATGLGGGLGMDSNGHVLRNVAKVERFVGELVRDTLVRELVWPNFQTIVL